MKKVLIGMSGGVDSSVAAFLLKKQGYEVLGATMILYDEEKIDGGCLSFQAVNDAKKVCDKLGIKHITINLKKEFKKHVIDNFINSYLNGTTPNPCVECNKYLKFGALFEKAKELGCDFIATGHYAKVKRGKLMLSRAGKKDQSYFLYGIKKSVLPFVIFPLAKYKSKEKIREIAFKNNLVVAKKKDSQEICFIPDNDYKKYIKKNTKVNENKGKFIDLNGNVLGNHDGIINYTIGQRKGLGISFSKPLYVIDIDVKNNNVILGEVKDLYKKELVCSNVNLLVKKLPKKITAKIRYGAKASKATITILENGDIKVVFDKPQRAITKGQSIVFYKNKTVLGGGIIIK